MGMLPQWRSSHHDDDDGDDCDDACDDNCDDDNCDDNCEDDDDWPWVCTHNDVGCDKDDEDTSWWGET